MARRVLAVLLGAAAARAVTLHGSMGSRSPLCNWYLEERQIPYTMVAPRPSAHPFNQYDAGCGTPEDRAKHAKWVVWANAALDPICFVENDRGQVVGTARPARPAVNALDELLESSEYLVDGAFSVSDVAVASYLNYVPLFFPSVNLGNTPNVCRYMSARRSGPRSRRPSATRTRRGPQGRRPRGPGRGQEARGISKRAAVVLQRRQVLATGLVRIA
ncbi:glutathione S-transferase [Aureococcus anophagefferens]|uniref:Glutathione S-transferase n=1 Tax=Aureococcus anophagefferens TaxID=44056 RepID=A0ABR1FIQ0_AURAN